MYFKHDGLDLEGNQYRRKISLSFQGGWRPLYSSKLSTSNSCDATDENLYWLLLFSSVSWSRKICYMGYFHSTLARPAHKSKYRPIIKRDQRITLAESHQHFNQHSVITFFLIYIYIWKCTKMKSNIFFIYTHACTHTRTHTHAHIDIYICKKSRSNTTRAGQVLKYYSLIPLVKVSCRAHNPQKERGWLVVWVLWHIKPYRSFNAKFCLYIHIYSTKDFKTNT